MRRIDIGAGVLIGLEIGVGAVLLVATSCTDEPDISFSLRRPTPAR